MADRGSPPPRRRSLAAGILAIGWTVALAVFLGSEPVEVDPDVYDLEHSRTYERQLEVIGGKAALMGKEIDDFIAGLGRGRNLAYTLAAGSALAALAAYFWPRGARSSDSPPGR